MFWSSTNWGDGDGSPAEIDGNDESGWEHEHERAWRRGTSCDGINSRRVSAECSGVRRMFGLEQCIEHPEGVERPEVGQSTMDARRQTPSIPWLHMRMNSDRPAEVIIGDLHLRAQIESVSVAPLHAGIEIHLTAALCACMLDQPVEKHRTVST